MTRLTVHHLSSPTRLGAAAAALLGCAGASALAQAAPSDSARRDSAQRIGGVVVTASGREEPLRQISATVQVITPERIRASTARSVTDLLAESAVGFLSEWTPAQTSLNVRGGASDGQGRDFRSDVLVLLNGRRAGTANLSKLSLDDVERIEVIRGPSSVMWGSQALGGVVNLITRSGQTSEGSYLAASGGSWGLAAGNAYAAGTRGAVDYYVGAGGARRGDYESGRGSPAPMENTGWRRGGGLLALGVRPAPLHRVELTARTDGSFGAGFRGSAWDTDNRETRRNRSVELEYAGALPPVVAWNLRVYTLRDVDDLRWGSSVLRSARGEPAAGFLRDVNVRTLDVTGLRFTPRVHPFAGNTLTLGVDGERSRLRSTRERAPAPGGPTTQVAPFDNNQNETVYGLYAEDVQLFAGDRVALRAGVRYTAGRTSLLPTPNLPALVARSERYSAVTSSAGATVAATPWLKLRGSYAAGFRAPTASELATDFTSALGGQTVGNPDLDPQRSQQLEGGVTVGGAWGLLDVALFQNRITDRIVTRLIPGETNRSRWENSAGDAVVRGVDAQLDLDAGRAAFPRLAEGGAWSWRLFANGSYHFRMEDEGAPATLNSSRIQRLYQWQGAVGTAVGRPARWEARLTGILRGPVWYDTEENLRVPFAEVSRDFVHRKAPFDVWNARLSGTVGGRVSPFVAVNNLFDVNEHPLFIALNSARTLADARFSNGGVGNSMPGRELVAGVQARF